MSAEPDVAVAMSGKMLVTVLVSFTIVAPDAPAAAQNVPVPVLFKRKFALPNELLAIKPEIVVFPDTAKFVDIVERPVCASNPEVVGLDLVA